MLAQFLLEAGVLKVGDFKLKSGQPSPYFLNFGEVADGHHLARLGAFFAAGVRRHFPEATLLYGPAYKGLPLAIATVQAMGDDTGYFSLRKEAKAHGEGGRVLGRAPRPEDRIVVIDDVMTTSATKREALEEIARLGGSALGILVGVDRQEDEASARFERETGVPVRSLATVEQVFRDLEGQLEKSAMDRFLAYRAAR